MDGVDFHADVTESSHGVQYKDGWIMWIQVIFEFRWAVHGQSCGTSWQQQCVGPSEHQPENMLPPSFGLDGHAMVIDECLTNSELHQFTCLTTIHIQILYSALPNDLRSKSEASQSVALGQSVSRSRRVVRNLYNEKI